MYGSSSPLRAELSAMYGPSCPLRAELSTGRVVHGPSCPGIQTNNYSKYITFIDSDCTYCTASKLSNICTSNNKNKKNSIRKCLVWNKLYILINHILYN